METLFYEMGTWLGQAGGWGYVVAPALMAGVAVLPIPAELPAMLNGMLFGPWTGSLITWVGALAGAQISFELARRLGRPAAERLVRESTLRKADELAMTVNWWGLLVPRLIPVVAFTALNWGAGLTPVSRWHFFWTTAVGIIPGVVLFTATGVGLPTVVQRIPWIAGLLGSAILLWGLLALRRRRKDTDSGSPSSPHAG